MRLHVSLMSSCSPFLLQFRTTFRKRLDDALVSVSFTDETLRTPGACPGLILSAEKVLAPGLKAALRHDAGASNTNVSLCLAKRMGGQDFQSKMSYIHKDRALVLDEAWHVDKATRLSGSYNFATQEARVSASRDLGALTASAGYAFSTEAPTIGLSHRSANRTLGVFYAVKDDEAAVQWACAPFTVSRERWFGFAVMI